MTRRRALTDEQCAELARWYESRGSIGDKAHELGISTNTLRDAILRGQGKDVGYLRRKISSYLVPRGTEENSQITPGTSEIA